MQPVVTSFAFSEDSQNHPNHNGGSSLHVINPQNLFRPPFIPCTYSFSVIVGVIGVNRKNDNNFEFKLISPKGETAIATNKITLPKNSNIDPNLPEEAHGFIFNFDFRNVALREQGKYLGSVLVNGKVIGEFPLLVYPKEN